jgi:DNA polymerase-3 subunit delta'
MEETNMESAKGNPAMAVIAGADRLNVQAANAFLKTLEEPPPRSVIILLTTEPQRILETILSRCLRLNFAGEPDFAASQGAPWVASFGELAAREQQGLLGRYRLLSMLLSRLAQIKSDTEKRVAKRSPLEKYDDIEPKLRDRWEDELSAAIEAEYRRERSELLLTLQWWLRDIWLQTTSIGRELLAFPNLAEVSRTVATRLSTEEATENLRVIDQLQRLLATNVQEAGFARCGAATSRSSGSSRASIAATTPKPRAAAVWESLSRSSRETAPAFPMPIAALACRSAASSGVPNRPICRSTER